DLIDYTREALLDSHNNKKDITLRSLRLEGLSCQCISDISETLLKVRPASLTSLDIFLYETDERTPIIYFVAALNCPNLIYLELDFGDDMAEQYVKLMDSYDVNPSLTIKYLSYPSTTNDFISFGLGFMPVIETLYMSNCPAIDLIIILNTLSLLIDFTCERLLDIDYGY